MTIVVFGFEFLSSVISAIQYPYIFQVQRSSQQQTQNFYFEEGYEWSSVRENRQAYAPCMRHVSVVLVVNERKEEKIRW